MTLMKKLGLPLAAAGALAVSRADGAKVVSSINQGAGVTNIDTYITNNDNAIYNSATFDVVSTYQNVLQSIKDHNPLYASESLNQIASHIGITIADNPTGEVNTGWISNYDIATGKVTLSNIGGRPGDYDVWNSADSNNNMMALLFTFYDASKGKNMLDFNGNGQTDANEALVQRGYLTNGFIGYQGGGGFGGHPPKYEFAGVLEEGEGLLIEDVGEWMKVKGTGLVPYGEYKLERSADLEIWETVEVIEAPSGASPGVSSEYEWQEEKAAGGRMYFRLKWVEP